MQGNPLKKTRIRGKGRKRERKMIKLNNGEQEKGKTANEKKNERSKDRGRQKGKNKRE